MAPVSNPLGDNPDIPKSQPTGVPVDEDAAATACLGDRSARGCIHVKIDESREVAASITSGEGVVLLAKPELRGVGSESGFLDCLENAAPGALHDQG